MILKNVKNFLGRFPLNRKLNEAKNDIRRLHNELENLKLLVGSSLSATNKERSSSIKNLRDAEFKVFSQWGDDGIIQYLIHTLHIEPNTFVEIGVENYTEANTRFLLMHDNWSGLIVDSSETWMKNVRESDWIWKYDLSAHSAFITAENINEVVGNAGFKGKVGLLSLDVDGNDYWVLKALSVIDPLVVIVEYNWIFGKERALTVPYKKDFVREHEHYSHLYFGASLSALHLLMRERGYALVGCDSHGANAYFVKTTLLKETELKPLSPHEAYVAGKYRQSRDRNGRLDFLSVKDAIEALRGTLVFNVVTGKIEPF